LHPKLRSNDVSRGRMSFTVASIFLLLMSTSSEADYDCPAALTHIEESFTQAPFETKPEVNGLPSIKLLFPELTAELLKWDFNDTSNQLYFPGDAKSISVSQLVAALNADEVKKLVAGYSQINFDRGSRIFVKVDIEGLVKSISYFPEIPDVLRQTNLSYNDYRLTTLSNEKAFFSKLVANGTMGAVFKPHPYLLEQEVVYQRYLSQTSGLKLKHVGVNSTEASFDGITIFPDNNHFDLTYVAIRNEFILKNHFDWVAFEFLSDELQPTLDKYVFSTSAVESRKAWRKIKEYFDKNGDGTFRKRFKIEINTLKVLKKDKIRIIALEPTHDLASMSFLTIGTTNLIWARNVPLKGKGLISGGLGHFNHKSGLNFQDFLATRYSGPIQVVDR